MARLLSSTSVGTVPAGFSSRYSGRRSQTFSEREIERQPLLRQHKAHLTGERRQREMIEGPHCRWLIASVSRVAPITLLASCPLDWNDRSVACPVCCSGSTGVAATRLEPAQITWDTSSTGVGTMPSSFRPGTSGPATLSFCSISNWSRVSGLPGTSSMNRACSRANPSRDIHHRPMPARLLQDVGKQFAERARPWAHPVRTSRRRFRQAQRRHHRIGDVADIDRLELRVAADHRHERQQPRHAGEAVEQRCPRDRTPATGAGSVAPGNASRTSRSPTPLLAAYWLAAPAIGADCRDMHQARDARLAARRWPPARRPRHGCARNRRTAAPPECPRC